MHEGSVLRIWLRAAPVFVVACAALAGSLGACVRELEPVISEDALTDEESGYGNGYGYGKPSGPACLDSSIDVRWRLPAPLHQGVCDETRIEALVRCYVTHVVDPSVCRAYFRSSPENSACQRCALSKETAPTYGALVIDHSGGLTPNVGGCIAEATNERAADGCGAKIQLRERCLRDACANCDTPDRGRCESAARNGVCAPYDDAPACFAMATAHGARARECSLEGNAVQRAHDVIAVFCGP